MTRGPTGTRRWRPRNSVSVAKKTSESESAEPAGDPAAAADAGTAETTSTQPEFVMPST